MLQQQQDDDDDDVFAAIVWLGRHLVGLGWVGFGWLVGWLVGSMIMGSIDG